MAKKLTAEQTNQALLKEVERLDALMFKYKEQAEAAQAHYERASSVAERRRKEIDALMTRIIELTADPVFQKITSVSMKIYATDNN